MLTTRLNLQYSKILPHKVHLIRKVGVDKFIDHFANLQTADNIQYSPYDVNLNIQYSSDFFTFTRFEKTRNHLIVRVYVRFCNCHPLLSRKIFLLSLLA